MPIPLKNRLKRESQRKLAELQDEAVEVMYAVFPNAQLHGGTAIWRCLGGNRFSEDLDFYAQVKNDFKEKLKTELDKRGLALTKFRQTENAVYAKVSNQQTEVSLELLLRTGPKAVSMGYEKADGSSVEIWSLFADDFLVEKCRAYLNRRLIRDLYDVFFLLDKTDSVQKTKKILQELVNNFKEPLDEKNLKTLVFSGVAPSSAVMLQKIKRRILP